MRKSRSLKVVILLGVLAVSAAGAIVYYWPQIFDLIEEEAIRADRISNWAMSKAGETLPGTPDLTDLDGRLAAKGFAPGAPIFVRIFKREFELEVWLKRDGKFERFATYPICMWSGDLGPKHREGDRQSPEGFYTVDSSALNPASKYHRSFNLGYPNAFDRAHGRTGSFLMVHGHCLSIGCYAMTDPVIDEIWTLVTAALKGGQARFQTQVFPFRMTETNLSRRAHSRLAPFWRQLKPGYDLFEQERVPPKVAVCDGRYVFASGDGAKDGSAAIENNCAISASGS
jgi:murein L,D-transpeptidase YafK